MPICTCPVSSERFDVPIWISIRATPIATSETNLVVVDGRTILREIPRRLEGLTITDGSVTLTEIRDQYQELGDEEYRVDYNVGWIYFNNTYYPDGTSIDLLEYTGRGILLYPLERIIRGDGAFISDGIMSVYDDGVLLSDEIGGLDFRQNIEVEMHPTDTHRVIINVLPDAGFGGAFIDLTDAPSTYVGQQFKVPYVNSGETGIEFTDIDSLIGLIEPSIDQSVPYAGLAGRFDTSKDAASVAIKGENLIKIKNAFGMTISNLLGIYGNMEVDGGSGIAENWSTVIPADAISIDTDSKFGNGAQKVTINTDKTIAYFIRTAIDNTHFYYIKGFIKNDVSSNGRLIYTGRAGTSFVESTNIISTTSGTYEKVGAIINPSATVTNLDIQISMELTGNSLFDGVELYDITTLYNAGYTTVEGIEKFISNDIYHEGQQSVGSPVELDQLLDNRNNFGAWLFGGNTIAGEGVIDYRSDTATKVISVPSVWIGDTDYTLLSWVYDNSLTDAINVGDSGNNFPNTALYSAGENGIKKTLVTTQTTPTSDPFRAFSTFTGVSTGSAKVKFAFFEGDYTHLTDEKALELIQQEEFGTFEIGGISIHSIGKNKVDITKFIAGKLNSVDGSYEGTSGASISIKDKELTIDTTLTFKGAVSDYIKVEGEETYSAKAVSAGATSFNPYISGFYCYDENKNWIEFISNSDLEMTEAVPSNCRYIRISILKGTVGTSIVTDIMVRLSTSNDIYKDFIEAFAHIDGELGDLPNGVQDDLDFERTKKHELVSDDFITFNTGSFANFDYLQTGTIFTDYKYGSTIDDNARLERYIQTANGLYNDSAIWVDHFLFQSTGELRILLEKGLYADLATAKIGVGEPKLRYELDTYLPRNEINNNLIPVYGKLWASVDGTYTMESTSGITNYFTADMPLNVYAQLVLNIKTDLAQQKEINTNRVDIDKVIADNITLFEQMGYLPDLNTTVKTSLVAAINEVLNSLDNKVIDLTYDSAGLFIADTDYILDDLSKVTVRFPAMSTDLTLDASVSLDNGVTTYPVKLKDTLNNISVQDINDQIADMFRNGTDIIVNRTFPASKILVFDEIISSTFGILSPENGIAELIEFNGLSLNQVQSNGDISNGTTGYTAVGSVNTESSGILINTASGSSLAPRVVGSDSTITGQDYHFKARFRVTNSDCLNIRFNFGNGLTIIQSSPVINQWYEYEEVFTATTGATLLFYHYYADTGTASGKVMEVDYLMATGITNTPLHSKTAVQLNAIIPTYFEGVDWIVNPELQSIGVNLTKDFDEDETGSISGSDVDYTLDLWKVNTAGGVTVREHIINYSTATTGNLVATRKKTIIGETYTISMQETGITGTLRIHIDGVSIGDMALSGGIHSKSFTATNAEHDIMIRLNAGSAGLKTYIEPQIEQGSSATTYQAYRTATQELTADLLSVGTSVRDIAYPLNGAWFKDQYIETHTLIEDDITGYSEGDTNNDKVIIALTVFSGVEEQETAIDNSFFIVNFPEEISAFGTDEPGNEQKFSTSSTNLQLHVAKGLYADLAEAKTALAGTYIQYVLADIVTTEIESDGSLIQESITTIIQGNDNFATEIDVRFNLNSRATLGTLIDKVIYLQEELDKLELIVAQNVADIVDIKAKTDLITVTSPVNLDDLTVEFVELVASGGTIPIDTAAGDGLDIDLGIDNTTYQSYDKLIIEITDSVNSKYYIVEAETETFNNFYDILYSFTTSGDVRYRFRLRVRLTTPTVILEVLNGAKLSTLYSTGVGTPATNADFAIGRIIAVKY